MNPVLIIGVLMNLIALPIVGRRLWFLFRLVRSGQPDPARVQGVTGRLGRALKTELVEVLGQRRLLKWTVPGVAHAFTFWAFVILGSVYVEAYGAMLGPDNFSIPVIGHWWILGFVQDAIALAVLASIVTFGVIRMKNAPSKLGRKSRFKGSHEFGAYLVLFFIFNVVWTLFLFRGAAQALGNFDNPGAFVSNAVGRMLGGLSDSPLHFLEGLGLLLHIGVMLVFLIEVVHSKHLHIMAAPINVAFKRHPIALGAAKPLMAAGKPVTLEDLDDLDEETTFGVGKVEDFAWKGILDFATCTECGRCQSQCPAWNTEKPLSPKLLIMGLRDHAYAAGPALLAGEGKRESLPAAVLAEAERPLVGATEGDPSQPSGGAVIDDDVLWSCVTCGACVQQCPVDIEHVDHILDMRRYQVLVESNFPAELNALFKGMESRGNPWNMSPQGRMDWAKGLDFDVPVVGEDLESLESVDWLFWVGCAGAYEDRAKKTTQAVAELLNLAGVSFGVLGNGETCTGDSARRAGNEFVFQGLAQQNIETFREFKVKKAVTTCAHCFNTLKNEYRDFGIELEVVHHTQLLNRLVREGRLTPVPSGPSAAKRSITYHDPCYLGRHNQVYSPPRELLQVLPGASYVEMPRNSERSFCCGAGGARMWMEEKIGSRINEARTTEAVDTGADQIAVGCPFCRVMLSDGLTSAKASGTARDSVEVLDVAQLLLAAVKGEESQMGAEESQIGAEGSGIGAEGSGIGVQGSGIGAEGSGIGVQESEIGAEESGSGVDESGIGSTATAGGSLFDVAPDAPAEPAGPPTTGGSLFDVAASEPVAPVSGGSLFDVAAPAEPEVSPSGGSLFDVAPPAAPAAAAPEVPASGGSLFDVAVPVAAAAPAPAAAPEVPASGGSLFDVAAPVAPAAPAPAAAPEVPASGGSLFDVAPPAAPVAAAPEVPASGGSLFDVPPPDAPASGGSLFDVAPHEPAAAAKPDVETILDADDEPAADVPPEPDSSAPKPDSSAPKPDSSAPKPDSSAHEPRTDADIHGASSLFDL